MSLTAGQPRLLGTPGWPPTRRAGWPQPSWSSCPASWGRPLLPAVRAFRQSNAQPWSTDLCLTSQPGLPEATTGRPRTKCQALLCPSGSTRGREGHHLLRSEPVPPFRPSGQNSTRPGGPPRPAPPAAADIPHTGCAAVLKPGSDPSSRGSTRPGIPASKGRWSLGPAASPQTSWRPSPRPVPSATVPPARPQPRPSPDPPGSDPLAAARHGAFRSVFPKGGPGPAAP